VTTTRPDSPVRTYTVPELAHGILKCSVPHVHKFIKNGELVAIRFGRRLIVDERSLLDFLERHKTGRRAG
jgi:excisionase family DNA binding protein